MSKEKVKRLGISNYFFTKEEFSAKHLQTASDAGFNFVEFWGVMPHYDCHDFSRTATIKKQLREHKVKVHSIHTTSGLPYDGANVSIFAFEECQRKAAVEEIKKNICTLALLDGEIAVIHPGGAAEPSERARRLQKSKDSIKELLEYSASMGTKIAIENTLVDNAICRQAEELREYVDSFRSNDIGICFDTSHANLTQDIFTAEKICGDKIIHLHISDNYGEKDNHFVPYEGQIDWIQFRDILKDVGYSGVYMFEIRPNPDEAGTLKKVSDIYDKLFAV